MKSNKKRRYEMCMIAFKPKGIALPKEEYLRNGERNNKDGIGIGLLKYGSKKILVKKDFTNLEHLLIWIKNKVKKEDTLIIHFRNSTQGKVDKGNRHPFPVTNNKELIRKALCETDIIMAHNGTISQYSNPAEKVFSDTQLFTMEILADNLIKKNLFSNGAIQKLVEKMVGLSRIIVLNRKGEIFKCGTWYEEDGIYYSNTQYKLQYFNTRKNYNYNYNYFWKNNDYYFASPAVYKSQKGSRKEKEVFTKCDGCGQYADTLQMVYKKSQVFLCKKCRRVLGKVKLNFEKKLENPETETCDFCGKIFKKNELNTLYGSYKVCKDCQKQFVY